MASALFGPDGTQAPEPDEVLPDALTAPAVLDGWAPPALPPIPDVAELQRAVSAAMAEQQHDSPPRVPARPVASTPRRAPQPRPQPRAVAPPPSARRQHGPLPPLPKPEPPPLPTRSRQPVVSQQDADWSPLVDRSSGSGSRIGCIVFLIFIAAAFAKPFLSLIEALLDLFR